MEPEKPSYIRDNLWAAFRLQRLKEIERNNSTNSYEEGRVELHYKETTPTPTPESLAILEAKRIIQAEKWELKRFERKAREIAEIAELRLITGRGLTRVALLELGEVTMTHHSRCENTELKPEDSYGRWDSHYERINVFLFGKEFTLNVPRCRYLMPDTASKLWLIEKLFGIAIELEDRLFYSLKSRIKDTLTIELYKRKAAYNTNNTRRYYCVRDVVKAMRPLAKPTCPQCAKRIRLNEPCVIQIGDNKFISECCSDECDRLFEREQKRLKRIKDKAEYRENVKREKEAVKFKNKSKEELKCLINAKQSLQAIKRLLKSPTKLAALRAASQSQTPGFAQETT